MYCLAVLEAVSFVHEGSNSLMTTLAAVEIQALEIQSENITFNAQILDMRPAIELDTWQE